nr:MULTISPECIES: hypothetical protein [unclassified Halorubrum]
MDEVVVVVETLVNGQFAEVGELDRVVLATAVDSDQLAALKIEDIPANGALGDIDRVIGGEIPVAPGVLGVEVSEEPAFSRFGVEVTDGLPGGLDSLGVVGVGGPIPAASKIEVALTPLWIPLHKVSADSGRGDESNVEPISKNGDRRERADARAAVRKGGPGVAVEQKGEGGRVGVELAMECDRPFRERAEVGVDWPASRSDAGDGVG